MVRWPELVHGDPPQPIVVRRVLPDEREGRRQRPGVGEVAGVRADARVVEQRRDLAIPGDDVGPVVLPADPDLASLGVEGIWVRPVLLLRDLEDQPLLVHDRPPSIPTTCARTWSGSCPLSTTVGGVVRRHRERHGLRPPRRCVVDPRQIERERRRSLDLRTVEVEPLGLIEEHGGHDPPIAPVRGDRVVVGPGSLGELDLVGVRRDAHRLDVDAELDRPERRHGDVGHTADRLAHHVVGHHPGLGDGVLPMLQTEELVAVERVGEPRHVAGHEDVVGDEAVDVQGAATGVGRHSERSGRQP